MKSTLTDEQQALHLYAIDLCRRQHRRLEWRIIEVLQRIDRDKIYRHFAGGSLFQYAVQELGLSESIAYYFISVARKAREIPELREAVASAQLSVPKASRIVGALNKQNACELIAFARNHSTREVDREVARRNPAKAARERVRAVSEDIVEVRMFMRRADFKILQRAREIVTQKSGKNCDLAGATTATAREYVERHDPVRKAERAAVRTAQSGPPPANLESPQLCARKASAGDRLNAEIKINLKRARIALKANQRHQVLARDGGRCTFVDGNGTRCANERWLQIHHINPVSEGGGNDPANLAILCAAHHDLTHQLALPLEGQVTWLREPRVRYSEALRVEPYT